MRRLAKLREGFGAKVSEVSEVSLVSEVSEVSLGFGMRRFLRFKVSRRFRSEGFEAKVLERSVLTD